MRLHPMCLGPAPLTSKLMNSCSAGNRKSECLSHRPVALDLNLFMSLDIWGALGGREHMRGECLVHGRRYRHGEDVCETRPMNSS